MQSRGTQSHSDVLQETVSGAVLTYSANPSSGWKTGQLGAGATHTGGDPHRGDITGATHTHDT